MTLLIRLIEHSRCLGCSAHGRTDEKTSLCLSCLNLKIMVSDRKKKLSSTLEHKWAYLDSLSLDTGLGERHKGILEKISGQLRALTTQ